MKRLIFTLIVLALMATPVLAVPTIPGDWQTYQRFDFYNDPSGLNPQVTEDGVNHYVAIPSIDENPFGTADAQVTLTPQIGPPAFPALYDGDRFWAHTIDVDSGVFIPNAEVVNPYKDIWIEVSYMGTRELTTWDVIAPIDSWETVSYNDTADTEQWGLLTLHLRLRPNPPWERLNFHFEDSGAGLDYIEVWTRCIPAPGAIILGSIGVGLVGWLRRRKSL